MLTSLAFIFLLGLLLGSIFERLKLPSLLGMIFTGIILGPHVLNLLDESILSISADLRQLALVIILTRAGLSLDLDDLKKVGRPAVLMCFIPACFEIAGVTLLAPHLLGVTRLEAAIMGSVLAAVSPAVIVPRMIKIMEEGYGKNHSIPQLILAGASVDDVFVIVLFTSFTGLAKGNGIELINFASIPVSIIMGILLGGIFGLLITKFFKMLHMRDSVKIIIILSISFLFIECENQLKGIIPISGLLAIMSMGIAINQWYPILSKRLSQKYNRLWVGAEILLFVLVGATVDVGYVKKAGVLFLVLICLALLMRMIGVLFCMFKTSFTKKERIFCMLAYTPKATVQAAIGGIPLAMNLACGQKVLTAAVVAILVTAPFGAIAVDKSYRLLLEKNNE
ncbi:cation:proton antiporter [Velocimicrobium porci]|uniref:Sodium:proton antiporter n=1 Tax=Velocimicrobium porci TaxID=2606634 RepID=A0A6L5XYQ0_9FIRM|nr:cation:proton antiporter [Velocimicrobium porci]MSS63935.1 sodium:proton antiporter [Velocimicrobium porci]